MKLHLRPATPDDAKILFEWRNDPETRKHSVDSEKILWTEHLRWLNELPPSHSIYIAERDGIPVGVIRAYRGPESTELSWVVAPEVRGQHIGQEMARILADKLEGKVFAMIEEGNIASEKIAASLGLAPAERKDIHSRIFVYWR